MSLLRLTLSRELQLAADRAHKLACELTSAAAKARDVRVVIENDLAGLDVTR